MNNEILLILVIQHSGDEVSFLKIWITKKKKNKQKLEILYSLSHPNHLFLGEAERKDICLGKMSYA